ncbi:hypothetical protein GEMRC1_002268 [Eukaryota sp. GEM-RC1]
MEECTSSLFDDVVDCSFLSNLRIQFLIKVVQLCSNSTDKTLNNILSCSVSYLRVQFLLQFAQFLRHQNLYGAANCIHQLLYHESSVDQQSAIFKTIEEIKIHLSAAGLLKNESPKRHSLLQSALDILSLTNLELLANMPFTASEMCSLRGKITSYLERPKEDSVNSFYAAINQNQQSITAWVGLGWVNYDHQVYHDSLVSFATAITLGQSPDSLFPAIFDCLTVNNDNFENLASQLKRTIARLEIWKLWIPLLLYKTKSIGELSIVFALMPHFSSNIFNFIVSLANLDYPPFDIDDIKNNLSCEFLISVVDRIAADSPHLISNVLEFFKIFENSLNDFAPSHCLQMLSQIRGYILNFKNYAHDYSILSRKIHDLLLALKQLNYRISNSSVDRLIQTTAKSITDKELPDLLNNVNLCSSEFLNIAGNLSDSFLSFDVSDTFSKSLPLFSHIHKTNSKITGISSQYFNTFHFSNTPTATVPIVLSNGEASSLTLSLSPFASTEKRHDFDLVIPILRYYFNNHLTSNVLGQRLGLSLPKVIDVHFGLGSLSNISSLLKGKFLTLEDLNFGENFNVLFSDNGNDGIIHQFENSMDTNVFSHFFNSNSINLPSFWTTKLLFSRNYSLMLALSYVLNDSNVSPSSFVLSTTGDCIHDTSALRDDVINDGQQSLPSLRYSSAFIKLLGHSGLDGSFSPSVNAFGKALLRRSSKVQVLVNTLYNVFEANSSSVIERISDLVSISDEEQDLKIVAILKEIFDGRIHRELSSMPWR